MDRVGQGPAPPTINLAASGEDVDGLTRMRPDDSGQVPAAKHRVEDSVVVHELSTRPERELPDEIGVERVGNVEVGPHDFEVWLGIVEEASEVSLRTRKICQDLPPGVVELPDETTLESAAHLDLERIVF